MQMTYHKVANYIVQTDNFVKMMQLVDVYHLVQFYMSQIRINVFKNVLNTL